MLQLLARSLTSRPFGITPQPTDAATHTRGFRSSGDEQPSTSANLVLGQQIATTRLQPVQVTARHVCTAARGRGVFSQAPHNSLRWTGSRFPLAVASPLESPARPENSCFPTRPPPSPLGGAGCAHHFGGTAEGLPYGVHAQRAVHRGESH